MVPLNTLPLSSNRSSTITCPTLSNNNKQYHNRKKWKRQTECKIGHYQMKTAERTQPWPLPSEKTADRIQPWPWPSETRQTENNLEHYQVKPGRPNTTLGITEWNPADRIQPWALPSETRQTEYNLGPHQVKTVDRIQPRPPSEKRSTRDNLAHQAKTIKKKKT